MSIKASEIVTAMTMTLKQQMIDLHHQIIDDVSVIVGNFELRMLERIDALNKRIDALEDRQRPLRESERGE